MSTFLGLADFSNIRMANGINKIEGIKLLEWATEYLKVFDDSFVETCFAKAVRTSFLGKGVFDQIGKRMSNISLEQILDLDLYFISYRSPISKLMFLSFHRRETNLLTLEDKTAVESILGFFKKWGYLTPKQLNFIYILHSKSKLPRALYYDFIGKQEKEIDGVLRSNLKSEADKKEKFSAEDFVNTVKEIEKNKIEKKQFLSLADIRKQLSI